MPRRAAHAAVGDDAPARRCSSGRRRSDSRTSAATLLAHRRCVALMAALALSCAPCMGLGTESHILPALRSFDARGCPMSELSAQYQGLKRSLCDVVQKAPKVCDQLRGRGAQKDVTVPEKLPGLCKRHEALRAGAGRLRVELAAHLEMLRVRQETAKGMRHDLHEMRDLLRELGARSSAQSPAPETAKGSASAV
mmetsp:Transcript_36642/g.105445  ORF Transcript_36642/g.105445 Transcript_36642/m.105445 type:complete len:195 (+) Transcript_36642:79-663(+)